MTRRAWLVLPGKNTSYTQEDAPNRGKQWNEFS
jgi:hypothetical protein